MRSEDRKYMPQLDAIRAAAIFLVMIQHWAPTLTQIAPWGGIGVRCFFVLSGFLITGILLRARDLIDAARTTRGFQVRQFYIRRSLRIFPIYYLTLIVACALGLQVVRDTFWWHAGYLSNFYIASTGIWHGYISHLWSLSVEEQFYLIWPALILAAPRRWIPWCFALGIFIAPITSP
jgi:peptidoglycan/LPS O-acetylase OafA/YrhL